MKNQWLLLVQYLCYYSEVANRAQVTVTATHSFVCARACAG